MEIERDVRITPHTHTYAERERERLTFIYKKKIHVIILIFTQLNLFYLPTNHPNPHFYVIRFYVHIKKTNLPIIYQPIG